MRLTFYGAAGEVTGSCTLIETDKARVLLDFGLFQGGPTPYQGVNGSGGTADEKNRRMPPIDPARLDAIILSHAHIDHSGRLPMLMRHGLDRPIYATPASIDLAEILLRDAASIQVADAARALRHPETADPGLERPLFGESDVQLLLPLFKGLALNQPAQIAPGVTLRFFEAGHILGAASVELTVRENGSTKVVVFSADLGPRGQPLLRDFQAPPHADLVVLESTYGDRDHKPMDLTLESLADILNSARTAGGAGRVLVPAFAIGRTQSLIYHIGRLKQAGQIAKEQAVYVDSPMAIEATELYTRHRELFDDQAWDIINSGDCPLRFPRLFFSRTSQQSRELNGIGGGAVIIAAAGMATAGRILHHLRHGLGRAEVHVLIAGFQSQGTLGRRLVEGDKVVRVMGESIHVNAKVHTLNGFSAHAGQSDLLRWLASIQPTPPRIVLTHGEDRQRHALASVIRQRHALDAEIPAWGESITI
jgi:metallo-beta-lactamase family protein